MSKVKLPAVTLISAAGNKQAETIASLYKSMKECDFAEVVLLTNIDIEAKGIKCVNVGGLDTWAEYNRFIVKELYKYFTTSHCLIVQYDSWVLDGSLWNGGWLDYDLIGARGLSDGRNNFNGGLSLRSHRFQKAIAEDDFIDITAPEDEILCRLYRAYIEKKYGFVYCTDEVADAFAFELHEPVMPTFAFHNFHHRHYVEHVIIRRSHAMGDIIMCEPLIDYYCKKGFQVVLDIPLDDMRLFINYPYVLKHISELNPKIKIFKDINLNMAYEINPKKLVLQSYYDIAGIRDGEYRNSILYIFRQYHQKLFKKYILIHLDNTSMPYRNSYGINWNFLVKYYERLGYTVLQVGNNPLQQVATHFTCPTKDMLAYMCKDADLVIGIDSGVCQLSVSLGTPCIILVGSVNLKLRYVDFDKIGVVQGECPRSELKNCYHNDIGQVGVECVINKEEPPCAIHSEYQIISQSNKFLL